MAQGQIDMLLSSKPEDRRMVFEEAAGITKFKGQKKEALRKLEYTEANLLRVADVIAEVKRQMGTLQRQAAKARRYQTLLDDVRMLDTHLAHKQYSEFSAEKAESENHVRMMTEQLEQLQQRLLTSEQEALETREAYHSIESQINQLRQQSEALRSQVQSAEGRIGFNNERVEELSGRIRQNEEQIELGQQQLDEQRREMLMAEERRSGGYRSAIIDMEAGPPPASLMAAPARVTINQPAPGASAPSAASAPPMPRHQATRLRRSCRSAQRPSGKAMRPKQTANPSPVTRPTCRSDNANSAFTGSVNTARICRSMNASADSRLSSHRVRVAVAGTAGLASRGMVGFHQGIVRAPSLRAIVRPDDAAHTPVPTVGCTPRPMPGS
jgi:hypothetical protein